MVLHPNVLICYRKVQVEKFGSLTLFEYEEAIKGYVKDINASNKCAYQMEIEFFQSNYEGNTSILLDTMYIISVLKRSTYR